MLFEACLTPDANFNHKRVTQALNIKREGTNVGTDGLPWNIQITCRACSFTGTFTVNKGEQNDLKVGRRIISLLCNMSASRPH